MAVDDLFGGDPVSSRPSPMASLNRWLVVALLLVVAGPCCCTGPIGAFLSLWIWSRAGDDLRRVELGLYNEFLQLPILTARNQAFLLMVVSSVSLCLQAWKFHWYEAVAVFVMEFVATWMGGG